MRNYPPTVNTESETRFALGVMQEVAGTEYVDTDVDPTMGAEDFSFMLEHTDVEGFVGASSMERLPVEIAIESTTKALKALSIKGRSVPLSG